MNGAGFSFNFDRNQKRFGWAVTTGTGYIKKKSSRC